MGTAYQGGGLLYIKRCVFKLSELEIDADKNWEGFGITELKELDSAMARGEVVINNGTRIQKIIPGSVGTMLMAHDIGNNPTWEYGPLPE